MYIGVPTHISRRAELIAGIVIELFCASEKK